MGVPIFFVTTALLVDDGDGLWICANGIVMSPYIGTILCPRVGPHNSWSTYNLRWRHNSVTLLCNYIGTIL